MMSGNHLEIAPMQQELRPLARSDRIKALTDHNSDFVPVRLQQKGRSHSVYVSLKRVQSGLMQRAVIVAPVESDADGE